MVARLDVSDCQRIEVVRESTNSSRKQGVALEAEAAEIEIEAARFSGKQIALWEDTAPADCIIKITALKKNGRARLFAEKCLGHR